MTSQKDFKRLVRARMQKTGEAYTAARAQIVKQQRSTSANPAAAPPSRVAKASDYAALAGMSDAAVKSKTGCPWQRWVKTLDHHKADQMSHREIVTLVSGTYDVGPWWAQTVAVGYERIKGLRARGQQRDGKYEVTKSRTFNVPIAALFSAWSDAKRRRAWLTGADTRVRTSTSPKSIRLDWNDGDDRRIVAVGFTAKGAAKSAVALSQSGFTDRDAAARRRQYWSEQLDALAAVLAEA